MDPQIVLPEVIGIGLAYVVIPAVAIEVSAARTPRAVICPENDEEATVRIDAKRAAMALFTGGRQRVCACSRWPGRAGCDRACEASL